MLLEQQVLCPTGQENIKPEQQVTGLALPTPVPLHVVTAQPDDELDDEEELLDDPPLDELLDVDPELLELLLDDPPLEELLDVQPVH